MIEENKQLLLVDLCARLPYGVKIQRINEPESAYRLYSIDTNSGELKFVTFEGDSLSMCAGGYLARVGKLRFKPYLRPLSSMTEEEIIEFNNIPSTKNYTIIENDLPWDVAHYKQIDWLNKKMFDFRGLIPKGHAIEVTKDNNPYKG